MFAYTIGLIHPAVAGLISSDGEASINLTDVTTAIPSQRREPAEACVCEAGSVFLL